MTAPNIATIGVFDGVHLGHRWLLQQLVQKAQELHLEPCVVTFSRHPLEIVNPTCAPKQIMALEEKVEAIKRLGVENVLVLDFNHDIRRLTAREFMEKLHRNHSTEALLLGFNHRFGSDRPENTHQIEEAARQAGIKIFLASELPASPVFNQGVSSSEVRKALAGGNVRLAEAMLGAPFAFKGTVVHGRQIGRQIGFPTANISPLGPSQLLPAPGVYAADVVLPSGTVHRAMLNIGHRPTVDTSEKPQLTAEAHIIDWQGDLYGATVEVRFIARLRDEKKFPTLQALALHLAADRTAALSAE